MANPYLVSTLIMGVLLALVVSYVGRTNQLRWSLARSAITDQGGGASLTRDTSSESEASVLAIVAGIFGTILLAVGISAGIGGSIGGVGLFIGFMAGMLGIYLVWGIYHIARSRGLKFAQSVGIGVWFLGLLLLLGILGKLLAS